MLTLFVDTINTAGVICGPAGRPLALASTTLRPWPGYCACVLCARNLSGREKGEGPTNSLLLITVIVKTHLCLRTMRSALNE